MTGVSTARWTLRLLALHLTVTATMGWGVATAQELGTPVAACRPTDATPEPTSGERTRLLLEARPPANVRITSETVCIARDVMAARLDAADIDAAVVVSGDYGISVTIAAEADLELVTRQVTRVGLLEIVDPRGTLLPVETLVTTSLGGPDSALPPSAYEGEAIDDSGYETILTSDDFVDAFRTVDEWGNPIVGFRLTDDAAKRFSAFTSANIGNPMAIVLDKRVISRPVIQQTISDEGTIQGLDEDAVKFLAVSLRSKALPVPFELVTVDGMPLAPDGTPVAGGA